MGALAVMSGKDLVSDVTSLAKLDAQNISFKTSGQDTADLTSGKCTESDIDVAPGTSRLVGKGEGEEFGIYASKAIPEKGYTDVIIHGSPDSVSIMHNGEWVQLNHRSLATYLKKDAGYTGGPIRLLSCNTGSTPNGFAQNLANKMGVEVKAPSDTIWAFSSGKLIIGPDQYTNTGKWNIFKPARH